MFDIEYWIDVIIEYLSNNDVYCEYLILEIFVPSRARFLELSQKWNVKSQLAWIEQLLEPYRTMLAPYTKTVGFSKTK